jgi:hypothetical protein
MARRLGVAVLLILGSAGLAAAQDKVVRINGAVTDANYRALAALLLESLDTVVGLNVTFTANDGYEDGRLSAYKEGGLFIAYVPGPQNDSQISAGSGYMLKDGAYVFDGFYKVVYGGMGQGIQAISLEKAEAPAGKPVEDVDIGSLKAPGN